MPFLRRGDSRIARAEDAARRAVHEPPLRNLRNALTPTNSINTLLPSAFSLQPSAFSLQPSAFSLQPSAFSLQPVISAALAAKQTFDEATAAFDHTNTRCGSLHHDHSLLRMMFCGALLLTRSVMACVLTISLTLTRPTTAVSVIALCRR